MPPELWANTKDLEAGLSEAEPNLREKSYDALMMRPDRHSRELVLHALLGDTEKDDGLRQRLLLSAGTRDFKIPPDILSHLARVDASPEIRWLALDGLSATPAALTAAQAALADSDATVRDKARQILDQLDHPPK